MKFLFRMIAGILLTVVALALLVYFFMQQAVFGHEPDKKDLVRIEKSPNYRDGFFQNIEPTETLVKGASRMGLMKDFFNKPKNTEPSLPLPSVKTNLSALDSREPSIVWFGHSSYLIQSAGVRLLVDPVFCGNAAPISFFGKSFPGSDVYDVENMPEIDVLVITHDHYDHLDYTTIKKLHPRVKHIVTSLGVGSHLRFWKIPSDKITELDWHETANLRDSLSLTAMPARHFSGRKFTQGKTLWSSFVLNINGYRLFLGGDSGYDGQFKRTGDQYGPFDLVMLEAGQYGVNWPYIHMKPEETVQAAIDLKAKVLMPVHWGKFALAFHAWNEPIERVLSAATAQSQPITTPMIGEVVVLDGSSLPSKTWWRGVEPSLP